LLCASHNVTCSWDSPLSYIQVNYKVLKRSELAGLDAQYDHGRKTVYGQTFHSVTLSLKKVSIVFVSCGDV